jgi:hypothetical protein
MSLSSFHRRLGLLGLAFVSALWACGGSVAPEDVTVHPTGDGLDPMSETDTLHGNPLHAVRDGAHGGGGGGGGPSNPLIDHNGPVVPGLHFYVIYWGSGFSPTTQSLYTSFLGGLGGSGYFSINSQYLRNATNAASLQASYADTASAPGSKVSDVAIQNEVHSVLAAGVLPYDANGLYFVITPKTTTVCAGRSCSCQNFCGYHAHYTDTQFGTVLYSPIPSAAACPGSCGVFTSDATSPNGNVEADEGVSILAHEAEETQSDALANAWFDRNGQECGDKCAYKYGPTTPVTTPAGNPAIINQSWGGASWLVQMNWSNQIGGCAQKGPTDGPYTR